MGCNDVITSICIRHVRVNLLHLHTPQNGWRRKFKFAVTLAYVSKAGSDCGDNESLLTAAGLHLFMHLRTFACNNVPFSNEDFKIEKMEGM